MRTHAEIALHTCVVLKRPRLRLEAELTDLQRPVLGRLRIKRSDGQVSPICCLDVQKLNLNESKVADDVIVMESDLQHRRPKSA